MEEEHPLLKKFAQQGYGLPPGRRMARAGGDNEIGGHRAQDTAARRRADALALARKPMVTGIRSGGGVPVGRNRGRPKLPVKARLGIPRKPLHAGGTSAGRGFGTIRGMTGARRGGGLRGGGGSGAPRSHGNTGNTKYVKKEDLDTELEEYMSKSKSKSCLDKELEDYMNQKNAEDAAALNAGSVIAEDDDVIMLES